MYKLILAAVMLFALASAAAAAGEAKGGLGLSEWLAGLQKKIAKIVPRKTVPVSNSVAGVRGANEACVARLYWKGRACDDFVTEEELTSFKAAVDLVAKGDPEAAIRELEGFMARFPDSDMIPDAVRTLRIVKAEGQAAKPAPAESDAEAVP